MMSKDNENKVVQLPLRKNKGDLNEKENNNVVSLPAGFIEDAVNRLDAIMRHTASKAIPKPQYGKFLSFARTEIDALENMPNDDPMHLVMKELDDEMHYIDEVCGLGSVDSTEFANNILKVISTAFEYGQLTQLMEGEDEYNEYD